MSELLYPSLKEQAPLEYGWSGYSEVILFSTDDKISTVVNWYRSFDLQIIDHSSSPHSVQLHLRKIGSPENVAEVLAVSTEEEELVLDLISYIGSAGLEGFVRARPATIGALFLRKKHET